MRLRLLPLLALALLPAVPVRAELTDQEILNLLTTDQPRDKAIRRGLEFIRKAQRADGTFGEKYAVANTSFVIMAHFASGHTLEDRQYGPALKRAVLAVLSRQDSTGYFGQADGSAMYGHGVATLMLGEAIGTTRDDDLEEKMGQALEKAVRVTVAAAEIEKNLPHKGGWRYAPDAKDSDVSLSGWQLMSLHAVQQVGMPVPDKVVSNALDYTRRLTTPDGKVGYQNRGEDHTALRGLALLCFSIGGDDKAPEVAALSQKILGDPPRWEGGSDDKYLVYRIYYDAVGLSRTAPEAWLTYSPPLDKLLLERQQEDGSWVTAETDRAGVVYTTSMSVLALAVQRHVLPAYQR